MKYLLALLLSLFTSPLFAAYPYDAVGMISAGGSGTLVYAENGKGLILTCAHVVPYISETNCTWGEETRTCKTVFVDYGADLALLVCDNPPVRPVPYHKIVGNFVVSTGYPWYSREDLHWQASIALATHGSNIYVTAKPAAGMSGGGAFDCRGYLVGAVRAHTMEDGILADGEPLESMMNKYKDPETWIPDASHVKQRVHYNYSPCTGPERSIEYNELTAPELPDVTEKSVLIIADGQVLNGAS